MKDKMRKCNLYLIGIPEGKERKGQMQGEMMTEKLPNMTKGIQEFQCWDFPAGPVVKACLPMQGIRVPSLVRELGSHMTCGQNKTKKNIKHRSKKKKHQNIKQEQHCSKFIKDLKKKKGIPVNL